MKELSNKELALLVLVMLNTGVLSWLLFHSLVEGIAYSSLALMGAVLFLLVSRWAGGKGLSFATISAAGGLGLLLGCLLEFGQVGLFSLSSLCLTIAERGGVDAAWRMFLLAPVVHLSMWLGCSTALATTFRARWLRQLLCSLGMVIGMVIGGSLPIPILAIPAELIAITSVAWMWLWMSLGMSLPHLWCIHSRRALVAQ